MYLDPNMNEDMCGQPTLESENCIGKTCDESAIYPPCDSFLLLDSSVRLSVRPSVRPSVCPSVRPSVRQHFACKHDNSTNINRIGPKLMPWMYLKSVLVKFEDG